MKLEIVEWYDHWGRSSGGWMPFDEIEEPKAMVMKSVGWVIKENKECILLSPDIDKGEADGNPKSNHEQCILKCAVKSRKKLKD